MNIFCSHIIPSCLILVLVFLFYWMFKLNKFEDYTYVIRENWKWLKEIRNKVQKRLRGIERREDGGEEGNLMTVIDLEMNRGLNEFLNRQDLKRNNSISLSPSSCSLKRKNSIDYTIQINSASGESQANEQNYPQNEICYEDQKQKISSAIQSNSKLNICFPTNLHVKTFLSPEINYQRVKQPQRPNLTHQNDYFKMYLNYRQRSKTELFSMKNASSNQNLQQRVSFKNLCEMNGIKTIKNLIKEGA